MEINIAPRDLSLNINDQEANLTLDLNSFHYAEGSRPTYTHQQSSPDSVWVINHNLGIKPLIQVYNTGSQLITGNIVHISNQQTIAYFSTSVAGYAKLN